MNMFSIMECVDVPFPSARRERVQQQLQPSVRPLFVNVARDLSGWGALQGRTGAIGREPRQFGTISHLSYHHEAICRLQKSSSPNLDERSQELKSFDLTFQTLDIDGLDTAEALIRTIHEVH